MRYCKLFIMILFLISLSLNHNAYGANNESITVYDYWEGITIKVKKPLADIELEKAPEVCKNKECNLNRLIPEIESGTPVPLRTPDKIIRVLIFPYKLSTDMLMGQQYIYLKVEEGDWVMGSYLIEPEQRKKLLTPLTDIQKDRQDTVQVKPEKSDKEKGTKK